MTRILVDLLFVTGRRGGMETYVRELYPRLAAQWPGAAFTGLVTADSPVARDGWFPGELVAVPARSASRISWARAELTAVPAAARRLQADLVHCPANIGPFRSPVPLVLTVHDLLPFRHPEWVPGPYAPVLRTLTRRVARAATRLLTVSEASRRDIVDLLGVPADAVTVTPLGAPRPRALPPVPRDSDLVLVVGNRMPHKNTGALLEAVALLPVARRPRVLLTGSAPDDPLREKVAALGLGDLVDLRDWLDDDEIERAYATATLMALPSLFEGFGLPVLEAMLRECPVLCSDIPVLREVAGDAACYADPRDPGDLARVLDRMLGDRALQRELAERGRYRAARFTWERTAALTADAFQRALSR